MAEKFEGDKIRPSSLYVQLHERKALGEAYVRCPRPPLCIGPDIS